MPRLFMVVNEDRFFLSHRLDIAKAAKRQGYDVTIVAKDTGQLKEIEQFGFKTIDLPIEPTGMNPIKEMKTLLFLYNLYRNEKPEIVHHVGLKNILWGGLAARLAMVPGVVDAVSGLGGLFNGGKTGFITSCILSVIRFNHSRKGVKVIFQNDDDKSIFLTHKSVKDDQVCFIKGSGIDLNDFSFTEDPDGEIVKVIFTARMVKEKGVTDLIEAAEILKPEYNGKVKFLLCGRLAENDSAITKEYFKKHCDGQYICWLGLRNDVKKLLKQSNIMAFPSYYREGLPKSLIEASAIGRPIITCNSVGCKDVVINGVNGYLIEPKDVNTLAEKLKQLIDNRSLRIEMGKKSREKAEKEFDINNVVGTHLKIYESLLNTN